MTHWYEEIDRVGPNAGHLRLAALARWMFEEGYGKENVLAMLANPMDWNDEYAQMQRENGAKYANEVQSQERA